MLKSFQQYIEQNNINSAKPILIGVSGGRDSVVLCELYFQSKLPFAIAHCNFNLRGEESDSDEAFVVELAKKYQVKLYRKSCNTEEYSKEKGISIQMAARELRFNWFKELIRDHCYEYYATAHHQDDAIETYLINQIRGTGIAGLHGILPKLGHLIHPLLFANRADIDKFINEQHLDFCEDSSNSSTKYLRNKVRHDLLPLLAEINPHIMNTISDNMKKIRAAEEIFQVKVNEYRDELCVQNNDQLTIRFSAIKKLEFAATLLYELIKEFGFNYSQSEQIIGNNETQSGAIFHSKTHKMLLNREEIIIEKQEQIKDVDYIISSTDESIVFPIPLYFQKSSNTKLIKKPSIAQLDYHQLVFPLKLRKWKKGDHFYPLGMKGHKKLLSDFFIDLKLSIFEKENVWLLCSGDDIVWIIGYRIDDRFKLNEKTMTAYTVSSSRDIAIL